MKIILNHYYYMKSTIDWCELNYIESEYIAEYWNSITIRESLVIKFRAVNMTSAEL